MSNDPFGQFSNIFANEFAKQFGTAAMTAWQEALAKSFTSNAVPGFTSAPKQEGFADAFGKWFGAGAAGSANPAGGSPLDFFQQFVQQFPGGGVADLGAGNGYLQFAQYIQKYLEQFSAGADPAKIAEQMSSAFQQSLDQFSSLSSSPWMNLFQQFIQPGDPAEFFKSATDVFQQNPFLGDLSKLAPNYNFGDFGTAKPAAVGPAREWQIAMQEVMSASERNRKARDRMQQHTTATFDGASKKFWRELGHGEGELKSVREIYDYWVNCAEEAYYEIVMTDEYGRDFGESINSQAHLKLKFTALLNRFLEMLNVPNRRELDGVIKNLADIDVRIEEVEQHSNRAGAEQELRNASAIKDLKKEVEKLRIALESRADSEASEAKISAKNPKPNKRTTRPRENDVVSQLPAKKAKDSKKKTRKKAKGAKAAEFEITQITSSKNEAR